MRRLIVVAAFAALSGCGGQDSESRAGGVTESEAKSLDEAAEMVEQKRLPDDALRQPAPTGQASQAPQAEPARK